MSLHDAIEIAKIGTPAGLIGTTAFQRLATSEIAALGVTGLAMIAVEHPLGGERAEGVARRAVQAVDQIAQLIGKV